jgi:hypothetical protein
VVSEVTDADNFVLTTSGYVSGLSGLTAGTRYYISGTAGALTTTAPTNAKAVFIADSTTSGWVQQYAINAVGAEFGSVSIPTGTINTGAIGTFADVPGASVTLPTAGTWRIRTTGAALLGTSDELQVVITDSGNTQVGNPVRFNTGGNTTNASVVTEAVVTTSGSATYKLRAGSNNALDYPYTNPANIWYEKISGFTPTSGQTVDYCGVEQHSANTNTNLSTITSTNNTAFGTLLGNANRVILTGAAIKGNMAVDAANGKITFAKAGAYNIVISTSIQSAGTSGQWGQIVKNGTTVIAANAAYSQTSSAGMQVVLNYTGDFAAGDFIDVRLNSTDSGTIGVLGYSYNLNQLGSSNAITSTPSYVQIERHSASVTANDYTISTASSANYYTVAASGQRVSFTSANGTTSGGDFTIGTNQITINNAGTYKISGLIAGEPTANSAVWAQLVLDSTTVLNASVQYAGGATFNSNVATQYVGSFSAGAIIDMRVGNVTGTTMGMHTTSLIIRRVIN